MVGALEAASSRKVDHAVGKPGAFMMEMLLVRLGARREESIVFGDTLESDIVMAKRAGMACVLVLHGNVGLSRSPSHELTPDLTIRSLSETVPDLTT
jgi:ribonucleotide monophosphatase NagD (HAD superfamily)